MGGAWYDDPAQLHDAYEQHGSLTAIWRATGVARTTLQSAWDRLEAQGLLPPRRKAGRLRIVETREDQWLLDALKKAGDNASVEALADVADVAPKHVRTALGRLERAGYRIAEEEPQKVVLHRVPPARENIAAALFDGNVLRVGVVSDTHMGSKEEAKDELHLAYDVFKEEGITEVWHAGDWGTGIDIFRGHHSEANVHTLDEQVDYLEKHYPRRKGIVTRGISGNHDIGGAAGKAGFDPIAALATRRDDIEYLGVYDAWIELRPGTGSYIHLLHGAGGMSYSYSYKAQKLVDSYPSGRKPAALIVGHWHVRGNIRARDVEVLWPGCFEWQSPFMKRLGLQPTVGFHILEITVAEDGSIVRWRPEWLPFYGGRAVA